MTRKQWEDYIEELGYIYLLEAQPIKREERIKEGKVSVTYDIGFVVKLDVSERLKKSIMGKLKRVGLRADNTLKAVLEDAEADKLGAVK